MSPTDLLILPTPELRWAALFIVIVAMLVGVYVANRAIGRVEAWLRGRQTRWIEARLRW